MLFGLEEKHKLGSDVFVDLGLLKFNLIDRISTEINLTPLRRVHIYNIYIFHNTVTNAVFYK